MKLQRSRIFRCLVNNGPILIDLKQRTFYNLAIKMWKIIHNYQINSIEQKCDNTKWWFQKEAVQKTVNIASLRIYL